MDIQTFVNAGDGVFSGYGSLKPEKNNGETTPDLLRSGADCKLTRRDLERTKIDCEDGNPEAASQRAIKKNPAL
jgi:hypothetical protein